jgi:hypothetical protein
MTPDLDLFVKAAGDLAAREAERLWSLDIYDPQHGDKRPRTAECLAVINDIIRANGWGANTEYTGNGPPQWCGMFAGKCWRTAGLDPTWLATYWASTYRIGLWARYERFAATSKANPPPADRSDRRTFVKLVPKGALAVMPRAGDIVIVGDGNPKEGDHVTLNVGYDEKRRVFDTISGNGGGVGPNGNSREGISRREYAIDSGGYRAMFLMRPAFRDLLSEVP